MNLKKWIDGRVKDVLNDPKTLHALAKTKGFEVWIDERAGVVRDIILNPAVGVVPKDVIDAELELLYSAFAEAFEQKAEELIRLSLLAAGSDEASVVAAVRLWAENTKHGEAAAEVLQTIDEEQS